MEPDQIDIMSAEDLRHEIRQLITDNITMRKAIKRALADAESGNGWGPDITVCKYLNAAIEIQPLNVADDKACPLYVDYRKSCEALQKRKALLATAD